MASQPSQRVRRIASPSTKQLQGPIRATRTFGLLPAGNSPTSRSSNGRRNSPSSSPTPQWGTDTLWKSRRSPDHRGSPERASPISPASKVDKSKSRHSPVSVIKRTGSLDTIAAPYLKGEWPRDQGIIPISSPFLSAALVHLTLDKSTQTPDEWEDILQEKKLRECHRRSSSLGNGDIRKKEVIKARLAKTTKESRQGMCTWPQHMSPVQGNHAAIVLVTPALSVLAGSATGLSSKSMSIPHIPVRQSPRIRGSVEGPSQEIEKLVLKNYYSSGMETDELCRIHHQTRDRTPDGHRAPIAELLRGKDYTAAPSSQVTVDTQTPLGMFGEKLIIEEDVRVSSSSSGSAGSTTSRTFHGSTSSGHSSITSSHSQSSSRSQSESPSIPIIPGHMDSSRPSSQSDSAEGREEVTSDDILLREDKEDTLKGCESPDPKSFSFVREPPDGCEKVKVTVEEPGKMAQVRDLYYCPIKKPSIDKHYQIPSLGSAFCRCPLLKQYVTEPSEMALKGQTADASTLDTQ